MPTDTTIVQPTAPLFDEDRLAIAGFLARYSGATRISYATDLRQYFGWTPGAGKRQDQRDGATRTKSRSRARALAFARCHRVPLGESRDRGLSPLGPWCPAHRGATRPVVRAPGPPVSSRRPSHQGRAAS